MQRTVFCIRPRRHPGRQRLPARARLAGGAGGRRHRAGRVADPPAHRDERRPVRRGPAARDRPAGRRRAGGQAQKAHAEAYRRHAGRLRVLPGSRELLARLTGAGVPWAVATSGLMEAARPALELLEVPAEVPVVTRDQVAYAKPDPDLFLAAAERLGADMADAVVVGDSIWDLLAARRARALGVGCCRAAMAARSWNRPAPTVSMTTRPISWPTWTRLGSGTPLRRPLPRCPYRGPVRAVERRRLVCQKSRSRRRGRDGGLGRHPRRHRARRAGGGAVRHQCVQQLRRSPDSSGGSPAVEQVQQSPGYSGRDCPDKSGRGRSESPNDASLDV